MPSKLKALWYSIPAINRYIIALMIPIILAFFVLEWVSSQAQKKAADLAGLAEAQAARISGLVADAQRLDKVVTIQEAEIKSAWGEVDTLRKRLADAKVQPPVPAPLDDKELAAQLQAAGLHTPPPAREDAVLVWDWRQAALRVPQFEAKLADAQGVIDGQDRLIGLQTKQIADLGAARDAWHQTATEQGSRAEALKGQAAALGKAVAAERRQKYIVGGVGVAGVLWVALRRK